MQMLNQRSHSITINNNDDDRRFKESRQSHIKSLHTPAKVYIDLPPKGTAP